MHVMSMCPYINIMADLAHLMEPQKKRSGLKPQISDLCVPVLSPSIELRARKKNEINL